MSCPFPLMRDLRSAVVLHCIGAFVITSIIGRGQSLPTSAFLRNFPATTVEAVALDQSGNIYITGLTGSVLPVTSNGFQTTLTGAGQWLQGYLLQLNPTGSSV